MSEQALHPNVRRALIPIILATLGVLAGMVISWEQPGRLVVGIVAVEAAALAVLIPFFAVWGRAWAGWFFPTICVITPP
ncbi:hypothetical protein HQ560_06400, partial [bacterium]|nr:hypothetical protein [bacterium]